MTVGTGFGVQADRFWMPLVILPSATFATSWPATEGDGAVGPMENVEGRMAF